MEDKKGHNCIGKDELLVLTKGNIEKFGHQVILVYGTGYSPSFAYSIGLYNTYKHPEIICFGLPGDLGHGIINDVAILIKKGEKIEISKNYNNIFKNARAEFLEVDERNIPDYFGAALNYYQSKNFPALQLIWTDRNDRFPWEDNFENKFQFKQPLLDRNADFKFREAKNLGIFTTRQWVDLNQPILRVVHDADGDWQFLTGNQMPEDIRLVCLEEMVIRDKTLNEVFNLDYGHSAERKFVGDEWIRNKEENER